MIGSEVASYYWAGLDPLGRELRIAGTPYTVIGVITPQGSVFGFSLDRLDGIRLPVIVGLVALNGAVAFMFGPFAERH